MLASKVPLFNFCKKEGLWNATQAGSILLMTRSHSMRRSGDSL